MNAQRSTGPQTAEGKAKISMNALKHGLTARQVILPTEDPDEFDSFRAALMNSLNPQDALEAALADKIAIDTWRLRRIPKLEASFFRRGYLEHASWLTSEREPAVSRQETVKIALMSPSEQQAHEEALKKREMARAQRDPLYYISQVLKHYSPELSNLSRHEAALTRSWFTSMHELERLQARRAGEHVPAATVVDVNLHIPDNS